MPKSKLRANHGGHSLLKGKGSVYHRAFLKRMDEQEAKTYLAEQASWQFASYEPTQQSRASSSAA